MMLLLGLTQGQPCFFQKAYYDEPTCSGDAKNTANPVIVTNLEECLEYDGESYIITECTDKKLVEQYFMTHSCTSEPIDTNMKEYVYPAGECVF